MLCDWWEFHWKIWWWGCGGCCDPDCWLEDSGNKTNESWVPLSNHRSVRRYAGRGLFESMYDITIFTMHIGCLRVYWEVTHRKLLPFHPITSYSIASISHLLIIPIYSFLLLAYAFYLFFFFFINNINLLSIS